MNPSDDLNTLFTSATASINGVYIDVRTVVTALVTIFFLFLGLNLLRVALSPPSDHDDIDKNADDKRGFK